MNSLRRRLSRVLLVLLGGMLIQWFLADRMIVQVGEREMETRLQHDADSLVSAMQAAAQNPFEFDTRLAGIIYASPYSGHYFVIQAGEKKLASPSFADAAPFDASILSSSRLQHFDGPAGQPLLVLAREVSLTTATGTSTLVLAVGEDLSELRRELAQFRLWFLGLSLLVVSLAMALQGRELRWALRPLNRVREAVLELYQGGHPPSDLQAPQEIQPLVDEIHRLLVHVEARLQQSRTAIGNLSHALKTPLTAIVRLLDDPRLQSHHEWRGAMLEQTDAIYQRIERELKRARLAGDQPTRDSVALYTEITALVQLLQRIHAAKQLVIDWYAPEQALVFDREDLLELIGTLADNACKWARQHVQIDVHVNGELLVCVADDGPGLSPEKLASLGVRGQREDESVPGHGLGLAIVRDIVELAGGELCFALSPRWGGLEVTARVPLARPI